ncbi:MAG TPA: Asp-tRNA(Asn)/Glu-tRNA(Gln) amidotransferase subunit GatC [Phnomibacter sp.]|nr:Asp-tRNA(Asn)/Glu-tRNA(Gln) amidotransferase subunit GatC [Phnomibacter sp.]
MVVDEKLIDHLANLARLEFAGSEKQAMIQDMQRIIGFVEKLNELDTTGVQPVRYMGQTADRYRQDEPGKMLTASEALQLAPHHNESFFKVPKVIRKDSK